MKVLFALALVAAVGAQNSTTVYKSDEAGVSLPQPARQVKADYTEEARANRIEGKVVLDVVVMADGTIGDVKVTESLDSIYGLDKNAVAAMRQWVFKPGQKDGKPVAVRVAVMMNFVLR